MNEQEKIGFDDFDDLNFPRCEPIEFDELIEKLMDRRSFLKSGIKLGAGTLALGFGLNSPNNALAASRSKNGTGIMGQFDGIPANTKDTVTLPEGFDWNVVVSWGDPLFSDGQAFDENTRGDALSQLRAFGDNTDGMALFYDAKTGKSVLVVNNEYSNLEIIHGNRDSKKPENQDDILKNMYAHGISVVEIKKTDGRWKYVKNSPHNRRITPKTAMEITGPLRGYEALKTSFDPSATKTFGTWNNCGNGRTPWNTYLTCEENFNGYFSTPDNPNYQSSDEQIRYGLGSKDWGYGWANADDTFNLEKEPNMPNTAGYVVEIDPFNPTAPKKLTALGRFKHENAELVISKSGRAVVYMGDDERGEYLYRFVSDGKYRSGSNGSGLLESGTLYAAKFNEDQTGKWLALTPETTGMSKEEICLFTRMAASKVKATTMDRPEWVATNPNNQDVFCCLTNNKNRGIKPNKGGDETPAEGPNPRKKNVYGQIVQWSPKNREHDSDDFNWTLYAMAGNPALKEGLEAGSENINESNMFNSPDGLGVDPNGNIWIQTDGNYSNEGDFKGMGNNQMLIGDCNTGEIKRFMVGPLACEVTALTFSQDKKTAFVGIQHPGENGVESHFPNGGNSVPRSSLIAIFRKDGGEII